MKKGTKTTKGELVQTLIGKQLREIHADSGYSCADVIRRLNMDRRVFFRLRRGIIGNIEPLVRVANFYGYTVSMTVSKLEIK